MSIAAAVPEFPGETERSAEEKGDQDAGERLPVNGIDVEFTVQEFRSGGLDGAGEKEERSGGFVPGGGFRLDGFRGYGVFARFGRVERIHGKRLEREARREQEDRQNCQKLFHEALNSVSIVF
jgi:hypothetical protein